MKAVMIDEGKIEGLLLSTAGEFEEYNITVKIVVITREVAKDWLTKNTLNRAIRRGNLQRLCAALRSGNWDHVNGETIVFDDQGFLLDGQHRLQAVVDTGIPMTVLVVWGVAPHKRGTIDTGSARAMGDYFAMQGYKNGRNLAAAVSLLALWQRGTPLTHHLMSLSVFPSYDAGVLYLHEHEGIVDNMKDARRMPAMQPLSELTVLGYLFERKDKKVHTWWVDSMIHGTQHPDAPSFTTLRERLLREMTSRNQRPEFEAFAYHIKAFNATRKKRHLRIYKMYEAEGIPALE